MVTSQASFVCAQTPDAMELSLPRALLPDRLLRGLFRRCSGGKPHRGVAQNTDVSPPFGKCPLFAVMFEGEREETGTAYVSQGHLTKSF